MTGLETTAALFETVAAIRKQISRGITVSIENFHSLYILRNMEYYSETDCFNAPTISIGPGKWGVGAFRSSLTMGTRGMLVYELFCEQWKMKERIFLLVGWLVPLMGDNYCFLHLASVDSPDFPEKKSERRRIFELLFHYKIKAGKKTIALHVNPEVEMIPDSDDDLSDHEDEDDSDATAASGARPRKPIYQADTPDITDDEDTDEEDMKLHSRMKQTKAKKAKARKRPQKKPSSQKSLSSSKSFYEKAPPSWISVSASMATSGIANLKVEVQDYQRIPPEEPDDIIRIPAAATRFSLTRMVEEKLTIAENRVNDALIKYIGMTHEEVFKSVRVDKEGSPTTTSAATKDSSAKRPSNREVQTD